MRHLDCISSHYFGSLSFAYNILGKQQEVTHSSFFIIGGNVEGQNKDKWQKRETKRQGDHIGATKPNSINYAELPQGQVLERRDER